MGGPECDLYEDPDGDYVQYEDVATELATLRAENAHLKLALALVEALRNKEKGFTV
jgi:hypothetical protein